MVSRSETDSPRDSISVRKVSRVDAGPGSRIAWCPSDSSRTAPIECGRPIQLRSSTVVESIFRNVTRASQLEQIANARPTLLVVTASNRGWSEYTNDMEHLRRAFAIVLSAVFLLAMALPALCGKCQDQAANSDCAQDHGGQPADPSSGYTDCDHCDQSPGISANRQVNPGASEFLIFLPDSPRTQLHGANRIAPVFATSVTNSVDTAVHQYVLVRETRLSNSGYRPLTVSLKI